MMSPILEMEADYPGEVPTEQRNRGERPPPPPQRAVHVWRPDSMGAWASAGVLRLK